MQVRARTKHLPISPRKLRLVCDQVRGMDAIQARTVLEHMPQKGAGIIYKTLVSAMANAENNFELNPYDLYVAEIYADEGPRLKRFTAGARGRYKPRVKRTAHLTVILAERDEEEEDI
ncbi:MAG: 50S ribosomal protein L22 [Chloroflexi bacterium]|nr:MAG: 50S ribosomal protein L22 [Phototrophicales bacterium]RMF82414.1 MAG: 50S ribosomal protein L22 [Chloroflexota bacterium]